MLLIYFLIGLFITKILWNIYVSLYAVFFQMNVTRPRSISLSPVVEVFLLIAIVSLGFFYDLEVYQLGLAGISAIVLSYGILFLTVWYAGRKK